MSGKRENTVTTHVLDTAEQQWKKAKQDSQFRGIYIGAATELSLDNLSEERVLEIFNECDNFIVFLRNVGVLENQ